MKILTSFTHPKVVSKLYGFFLLLRNINGEKSDAYDLTNLITENLDICFSCVQEKSSYTYYHFFLESDIFIESFNVVHKA